MPASEPRMSATSRPYCCWSIRKSSIDVWNGRGGSQAGSGVRGMGQVWRLHCRSAGRVPKRSCRAHAHTSWPTASKPAYTHHGLADGRLQAEQVHGAKRVDERLSHARLHRRRQCDQAVQPAYHSTGVQLLRTAALRRCRARLLLLLLLLLGLGLGRWRRWRCRRCRLLLLLPGSSGCCWLLLLLLQLGQSGRCTVLQALQEAGLLHLLAPHQSQGCPSWQGVGGASGNWPGLHRSPQQLELRRVEATCRSCRRHLCCTLLGSIAWGGWRRVGHLRLLCLRGCRIHEQACSQSLGLPWGLHPERPVLACALCHAALLM